MIFVDLDLTSFQIATLTMVLVRVTDARTSLTSVFVKMNDFIKKTVQD